MKPLILFAFLAGCQAQPYDTVEPSATPARLVASSCDYAYSVPSLPAGTDPACEIATSPTSWSVTTSEPYAIALTVPGTWTDTTAVALNAPGAKLVVGGFSCTTWAGLVTWGHDAFRIEAPATKLWYVEINAQCTTGPDTGFAFDVTLTQAVAASGWVRFGTFQIQADWDALDDLADSEAQCASNGWRLPTSEEWRVVITAGYQGVRPVFYQEWWRDQPGDGPGVWGVIGGGQGQNTGAYAYRCAHDVA